MDSLQRSETPDCVFPQAVIPAARKTREEKWPMQTRLPKTARGWKCKESTQRRSNDETDAKGGTEQAIAAALACRAGRHAIHGIRGRDAGAGDSEIMRPMNSANAWASAMRMKSRPSDRFEARITRRRPKRSESAPCTGEDKLHQAEHGTMMPVQRSVAMSPPSVWNQVETPE